MRYDPNWFAGLTVAVTGGTGSFGELIVRKLLSTQVAQVRVFSRDEQKHVALQRKLGPEDRLKFVVGDVRDVQRLHEVFDGASIVFHAAAIKHVHLTELHPMEAVKTNVIGASNVVNACRTMGVLRCVAISTDKAVQPVNVMGMSKALQERIVSTASGPGFVAGCVRYGNVLGSNGSVVPYFRTLLDSGVTTLPITHPDMTRFMLTLDEGVDMALFAMSSVEAGEIVVLERPSFLVKDLAEVMLEKYGGGNLRDMGIRPGEKLHEILVSEEEGRRVVRRGEFTVVRPYTSENERFGLGVGEVSSEKVRRMTKDELRTMLSDGGFL